jgi:hypothetical protein
VLLEDLANPKDALNGEDALFVDNCESSSGAGPIALQSWNIADSFTMDVIGGTDGTGAGCWSFAAWTEWAPYAA